MEEEDVDFSKDVREELRLFENYLSYRKNNALKLGNMNWVIFDSSEFIYKKVLVEIKKIASNYNVKVIEKVNGEREPLCRRLESEIWYDSSCVAVFGKENGDEDYKEIYKKSCQNAMFFLDLNNDKESTIEDQIYKTINKYGFELAEDTNLSDISKLSGEKLENNLARAMVRALNQGTKVITNECIELKKDKKTNQYMNNFESLIGLNEAKKTLNEIINYLSVSKSRNDIPSLHMAFLGNPGTGKTTVAQVLGGILSERKLLSADPPFVEVGKEDLVGKYIGHTEKKVLQKIEEAKGGILFIDEAYSLSASDSKRDFGYTVINTLVKQLDVHRGDLCVIFAGYTDEMLDFFKSNPGLSSRVPFKIKFSDYSAKELLQIFNRFIEKDKFKIQDGYEDLLLKHFKNVEYKKNKGNGRYVRNLYERIKIVQANRVIVQKNNRGINTIKLTDIKKSIDDMKEILPEKMSIGF